MYQLPQINSASMPAAIALCTLSLHICIAQGDGTFRNGPPVIWDGEAGDMMWFNPTNWDPDGLPGESSSVLIQMGGPVIALNQPIAVDSLAALTGLTLSSSTIAISNPSSIDGLFVDGLSPTIDSSTSTLEINGTSVFNSAVQWGGTGTTLNGSAQFLSSTAILENASLIYAGDVTLFNGTASIRTGGSATITGTFRLAGDAALFSASNADALWVVDGGSIGDSGGKTTFVSDKITMISGNIFSDNGGEIFFDDFYNIINGTVTVSNGGIVEFNGSLGTELFNKVHVSEFSGDGDVVIFGSPTSIGSQSGLTTASLTSPGELFLRDNIIIADNLTNMENMTLFGASLTGDDGRLTASSGVIKCRAGSLLAVETIVQSGGKIVIEDDTRVDRTLRVNSGGILELNKSINAGFPDQHELAKVEIAGQLLMPFDGFPSDINIPLNLLSGGSVSIEDRRLQLKGGGRIQNGSISLVDSAGVGIPSLTFGGDNTVSWVFETGATISHSGERVDLFFGNGFGSQPSMMVNSNLTLNITGQDNAANLRVPSITGSGSLINNGNLLIERSLNTSAGIKNFGIATYQSIVTTTVPQVIIENKAGGTTIQKNSIVLDTLGSIINAGTWNIPNSVSVQPSNGGDPDLIAFTNNGTLIASSGNSFFPGKFVNNGTVIADTATLTFSRAISVDDLGRNIISGIWETRNNGKILMPEQAPSVAAGPDTKIIGGGTDQPWVEDLVSFEDKASAELEDTDFNGPISWVDASVGVGPSVRVTGTDIFFSDGSTGTVNPGATLEADNDFDVGNDDLDLPSVTDDIGGVVFIGLGPVIPPTLRALTINVYANLTPIRDDTGTMIVDSDLIIHPTGKLNINLDAGGLSSNITISRTLTLDGSVIVTNMPDYTPVLGDSFVIAQVTGAIGSIPLRAQGDAGEGLAYGLSISGSEVIVSVVCLPDLNADGNLNFFDVSAFLSAFGDGDPAADFTDDGNFNFFDVSAFLQAFSGGCS